MLSAYSIFIRLLLSVLLSGLVGLERQLHRRTAGLRTHILVCLGSCLIMLTSIHVFDIFRGVSSVDPTRIAAGVITGIGFLGAGAIIRSGEAVKGLTTAASLWIVAGIGLAVGCGFYLAAIISSVLALTVLLFLRHVERFVFGKEESNTTN
jgi:putative Mg2+ transporter-C (MgtC) family protein